MYFSRTVSAVLVVCTYANLGAADEPLRLPPRSHVLETLQPGHPRLHLGAGGFDALKSRIRDNRTLAEWYVRVRNSADDLLSEAPNTYRIPDGKRLLGTSRSVLQRVYTLALAFRIEGDTKYLDRAWEELEAAARFKDWNPSHFLDTAEMTHAFAIGYDWLYHDWSQSQRTAIREAMIRHGLTPGLRSYRGQERYGWFVRAEHNWNQVCNGGLTAGALAIADEEPELAAEIIHGALQSIQLAMREYAPDGAYHEGPGYWGYGTAYNVLMIAVLESALGDDFGLTQFEGFDRTVLFPMQMTGPSGRTFNFADCSAGRPGRTFSMFWLAKRFNHPDVVPFAARFVRATPLDILCFDPEIQKHGHQPPERSSYWRGVEAVSLRSSWEDPEAVWIAFKGDRPGVNHGQADLGSFVLEALGQRWAVDLGADNYNLPGYFDVRNRRWHFYRNRAEGHNTLVINPGNEPDQAIDGKAKVVGFGSHDSHAYGILDLTPAYAENANSVRRGIALLKSSIPVVQDEIELKQPSSLWWFMHTPAAVSLDAGKRQATLTLEEKQLIAHLVEPADAEFRVLEAVSLPSSPTVKGQKVNKGVRKLAIQLDEFTSGRVSVAFCQPGTAPPITVTPLNDWGSK